MKSKEELYNFIATFNRNPGEYTSEELYKIGVAHKSLPNNEKNWKDLANALGYAGTSDSYRCFVNRRQKADGTLTMADESAIISNPSEYEQLYREKTQIRDIYNDYRFSLRNEARVNRFKEELFNAIRNQKNQIKIDVKPVINSKNKSEAILMFSDLHLGADCDNFYNKFNFDVAKTRISKLTRDTIWYCKLNNVQRLNVINLGDLISGNIHTNARIAEQFSLIDQITKAAELTAGMLAELAKAGLVVTYRSCTDNHSRAIASKDDNIEAENFNRIIDWYLEAKLEKTPIKFINDNIDISLGKFDLLNGKKVMFAHGHLENVNKCVDAFCGATKEFIDYVLLSHYHASREKSYNGSKLFINGSIVGTEQYALSRRLFSPAEQKLLIFDNDNCLDININLQ